MTKEISMLQSLHQAWEQAHDGKLPSLGPHSEFHTIAFLPRWSSNSKPPRCAYDEPDSRNLPGSVMSHLTRPACGKGSSDPIIVCVIHLSLSRPHLEPSLVWPQRCVAQMTDTLSLSQAHGNNLAVKIASRWSKSQIWLWNVPSV